MILLVFIPLLLLGYLVVEEKERRAVNPAGPRWSHRMRKSAKRKSYFVIGTALACGIQVVRGKPWSEIAASAGILLGVILFMVLHEAMLSLPRSNERA